MFVSEFYCRSFPILTKLLIELEHEKRLDPVDEIEPFSWLN